MEYTRYPKINSFLQKFVMDKKLSPLERMSNRFAYMGTGLIMMSPYLLKYDDLGAYTYIFGALFSMPQVWLAKQWNLVAINANLLIGYGIYMLRHL